MAQFGRPSSDITTNWSAQGGPSALYDCLNESSPSDTDYIRGSTQGNVAEVKLNSLTDPVSSSSHIVRVRCRSTGSGQTEQITVALVQGTTVIATAYSNQDVGRTNFATLTAYTLTSGQADSISDYTDLRLRFTASRIGASESIDVSWAELEVPDVTPRTLSVSDSITVSENVASVIPPLTLSVSDSISVSEGVTVERVSAGGTGVAISTRAHLYRFPLISSPKINLETPLAKNLEAYWSAYGLHGTKYLSSLIKGAPSGTLQSAAAYNQDILFGNVMDFSGSSGSWTQIDNNAAFFSRLVGPLTVSVWLNLQSAGAAFTEGDLFGRWSFDNKQGFGLLYKNDNPTRRLKFFVYDGATEYGRQSTTSNSPTNLNEWCLVTGVYDRTNIKLYINDQLEGTGSNFTGDISHYDSVGWVGRNFGNSSFIDAQIGPIGIWSRALSLPEIQSLYDPATRWQFFQQPTQIIVIPSQITEINIQVSDSVSISESVNVYIPADVSVSDNITVSEQVNAQVVSLVSVSDNIGSTEEVQVYIPTDISIIDSIGASEQVSLTVSTPQISISEDITISEAVQVMIPFELTVSDSISVAEAVAVAIEITLQVSETIAVSESIAVAIITEINVSDSISITEAVALEIIFVTSVSDNVVVSEQVSLFVSIPQINVSDSISVNENSLISILTEIQVLDLIAIAESVTVEFIGLIVVSDTVSINESIIVDLIVSLSVSDSITVTENMAAFVSIPVILVSDSITLTEDATIQIIISAVVSDTLSLAESIDVFVSTPLITVADSIALTEVILVEILTQLSVLDLISLSEQINAIVSDPLINISDTIVISENVSLFIQTAGQIDVFVSDNIGLSEQITFYIAVDVQAIDSINLTESVNGLMISFIQVSDNLTLIELAQVEFRALISISESITITENAESLLISLIQVSDLISLTESITLVVIQLGVINVFVVENVVLVEFIYVSFEFVVQTSENIILLDSPSTNLINQITVSENITTSDLVSVDPLLLVLIIAQIIAVSENINLGSGLIKQAIFKGMFKNMRRF